MAFLYSSSLTISEPADATTMSKKDDVGQIRTDAPEGTRFLVLRDNHSATTPEII